MPYREIAEMGSVQSAIAREKDNSLALCREDDVASNFPLTDLPEDVLERILSYLSPADICNLDMASKDLRAVCSADKVWWNQCEVAFGNQVSRLHLQAWWAALPSWRSIFRFMYSVNSMIGIWVHKNPERGNLVFITWGFLSVVGCRVIPQSVGHKGLENGLMWAPVFEIVCSGYGSAACFLYGCENGGDCCYPGFFNGAKEGCNVLLLEAEPRICLSNTTGPFLAVEAEANEGHSLKFERSLDEGPVPFDRLHSDDKRKILHEIAGRVTLKLPKSMMEPLFSRAMARSESGMHMSSSDEEFQKEVLSMTERRSLLMRICNGGDLDRKGAPANIHYRGISSDDLFNKIVDSDLMNMLLSHRQYGDLELTKAIEGVQIHCSSSSNVGSSDVLNNGVQAQPSLRQWLVELTVDKMNQIVESADDDLSSGFKRAYLVQRFLGQSDSVALGLHAHQWYLDMYGTWPLMENDQFALYKLAEPLSQAGKEHPGLWSGTFGWPHGQIQQSRGLYLLLLSYDDTEEGLVLTATKILNGGDRVSYPNGSQMFKAYVDRRSDKEFPSHTDKDGERVEITHAYEGDGIASGYGYRYPSSEPGDLFVEKNGLLAFVWRESGLVLNLQRLNLRVLLEKGKRVPAIKGIDNYAYLERSYENVYAHF
ncbi:hypothetical protein KP509_17G017300 [Ceratopteris richardii]|uniref:F-box domain-containing protein n=1 Tax=Ceratopteris richardii TaxID=49495 RepID=A0A8T2SSH3_CERRI|nr:hypothetical protein KP509_17G017300 [Ceratopteris richardii]